MPEPWMIKLGNDTSVIEVHTSDRQTYKRCRRKFEWGSTIRQNLIRIGPENSNFFLGTGFHFALEDYWGYRRFEHPALAFASYYDAQKRDDRPDDAEELLDLAVGMLTYYHEEWLEQWPEPYETLWVGDKPQVEVEVRIDITDMLHEAWEEAGYDGLFDDVLAYWGASKIEYVTTFDRVVIDPHERIYPEDYKTAATFDELNLQTNPQAGAYDWSANLFYTPLGFKVEGMIWHQFKKTVPHPPKLVNVGKANEGISTDKRQSTTYRMYLREAKRYYKGAIPEEQAVMLSNLANMQDDDGDAFIRRGTLYRNSHQREMEQERLVQEVLEMLDPELPTYPNFTKDCSWDCPFKIPCLGKEDGSDFEHTLSTEYATWLGYKDDWRKRVMYPDATSPANT